LKIPIHVHFYRRAMLTHKVGHTGLVFGVGSLVGPSKQDYKSLYVAAVICSTLVNLHTHTPSHTDSI